MSNFANQPSFLWSMQRQLHGLVLFHRMRGKIGIFRWWTNRPLLVALSCQVGPVLLHYSTVQFYDFWKCPLPEPMAQRCLAEIRKHQHPTAENMQLMGWTKISRRQASLILEGRGYFAPAKPKLAISQEEKTDGP